MVISLCAVLESRELFDAAVRTEKTMLRLGIHQHGSLDCFPLLLLGILAHALEINLLVHVCVFCKSQSHGLR